MAKFIVFVMELEVQPHLLWVAITIVSQVVGVLIIIMSTTLMTHYGMGQDVSIVTVVAFLTSHGSIVS